MRQMYDNEMPTICQSTHPKQTKDKRECDENLLTCGFTSNKKLLDRMVLVVQKTEAIPNVIEQKACNRKRIFLFSGMYRKCVGYSVYVL